MTVSGGCYGECVSGGCYGGECALVEVAIVSVSVSAGCYGEFMYSGGCFGE